MPLHNQTVILLTGAPISSSLNWSDETLQTTLVPSFTNDEARLSVRKSTPEFMAPLWRSLPLHHAHLPTGLTQTNRAAWTGPCKITQNEPFLLQETELSLATSEANRPSNQPADSTQDQHLALSQYYEHSFAVHEVPSSLILPPASSISPGASSEDEGFSGSDHEAQIDAYLHAIHARLASGPLSDLKEMPNASYLHSINPQTMTVNLVVGIISVSQPRYIVTRKSQKPIELVEMTVGDDTRAGFGISIWLPVQNTNDSSRLMTRNDDLREQTLCLRPQDTVLARNVALGSFRGVVHGQSLRGITTLDLLYRNHFDVDGRRGAFRLHNMDKSYPLDPSLDKFKRVRDWVLHFVGTKVKAIGASGQDLLSSLPVDTP